MEDDSPIFVLSTGRCGTLALQRFFNRSTHLEAFHRYRGRHAEYRNDMSILLEQNYTYYRVLSGEAPNEDVRSTMVDRLRSARMPLVERLRSEGKRFLELNHEFTPFGELLLEAFPEARFVHLVRNPMRVVASFMRKFSPPPMAIPAYFGTRYSLKGQYVLRYGHVKNLARWLPDWVQEWVESHQYDKHLHPFENRGGQWVENQELDAFEKTCWYWNEINRLVLDLFTELEDDRTLTIHSEELFERDPGAVQRLMAFVDPPDLNRDGLRDFLSRRYNPKSVKTDFPPPEEWKDDRRDRLRSSCADTARDLNIRLS